MAYFENLVDNLSSMGIEIFLVFLLTFTIVFALLQKIQILGTDKKIHMIISLVIAFFVIQDNAIINIITNFLPNVSLLFVVILMFLLMIGIFAGKSEGWTGTMFGISVIVSIIFIIWALSSNLIGDRWSLPDFWYGFDDQTRATIIFIAVFVIIIAWISGSGGGGEWFKNRAEEIKGGGNG